MTQVSVLEARRDTSGGYKVDVGRGDRIGRVSSEWFSRPADERYLSLSELARSVRDRADRSQTRVVESALIHVEANRSDPERLALILPGRETPIAPTHWSFGQLASLGEVNAAMVTNEKRGSDLVFEIPDTSADGRLLNFQRLGCAPKASALGGCNNVAKMAQFDRQSATSRGLNYAGHSCF